MTDPECTEDRINDLLGRLYSLGENLQDAETIMERNNLAANTIQTEKSISELIQESNESSREMIDKYLEENKKKENTIYVFIKKLRKHWKVLTAVSGLALAVFLWFIKERYISEVCEDVMTEIETPLVEIETPLVEIANSTISTSIEIPESILQEVLVAYNKNVAQFSEKEIEEALAKATKDKENTIRYAYYQAELVHNAIKKAAGEAKPPKLIKDVVISDMKSVKMTDYSKYVKLAFPFARELLKTAADYYPGMLHQCFVINAPKKAIRLMMTMLKPVVEGDILDKVKVYGRKQHKWEPVLLEAIPKDQLLVKYGGSNTITLSPK